MDFVTVADLERRPTEAVLGFEQHGFGMAVLRVRCEPTLDEPVYFPPCTADPDLALVLLPDGWLTHGALIEAARVYLRCSGEWGPVRGRGEEVDIRYWTPRADRQPESCEDAHPGAPALSRTEEPLVFLHADSETVCGQS